MIALGTFPGHAVAETDLSGAAEALALVDDVVAATTATLRRWVAPTRSRSSPTTSPTPRRGGDGAGAARLWRQG